MKYLSNKPKIILIPYPAQGHVTPMLMLAATFDRRGFLPIVLTPSYIHRRISSHLVQPTDHEILFVSMPDGLDDDSPRDFFTIENAMETTMPVYLRQILSEHSSIDIVCMVVDLLASPAIEIGREFGIAVAGFWPAMFATYTLISTIPDMVLNQFISSDTGSPEEGSKRCVPNEPLLRGEELPWLIGTTCARKRRFKFWTRTIARAKSLRWLLVNSFPEEHPLQKPNRTIHKSSAAVFQIGPLRPEPGRSGSLWEEDDTCVGWLEKQKPKSVIYMSFGSWVSPINESKVRSLAMALLALRKPFIWVLRTDWRHGLPIGFQQKIQSYGKLVSWAPQIEILKHRAVDCYLTHCGWNSIMEAIQCRKRLLCFPVAGDQFLNCGYVVKVWRIGVRLNGFGENEVEEGLRKLMEDEEMEERLMKLHERIMGEEANYSVNSSFTTFINDVKYAATQASK